MGCRTTGPEPSGAMAQQYSAVPDISGTGSEPVNESQQEHINQWQIFFVFVIELIAIDLCNVCTKEYENGQLDGSWNEI